MTTGTIYCLFGYGHPCLSLITCMPTLRNKLYRIVFRADTRPGRLFDLILLGFIVVSVLMVILERIPEINVM